MDHVPSPADFRTGITAAAQTQASSTALAFLQRIQQYYQQQRLSELPRDDDTVDSDAACMGPHASLNASAFHSVMACALQTGDCAIVQRTFDDLKATVGLSCLEHKAWIMLLQVCVNVGILSCASRRRRLLLCFNGA